MDFHTKCERVFRSKHFRSLSSVLLTLWILALGITGVTTFFQEKSALNDAVQAKLSNVTLSLSSILNRTQTNAVTVGQLDSINYALQADHPDMDIYRAMSRDLCSATELYEYRSVDLFMEDAKEIYISDCGLYSYAEYPDTDVLQLLLEQQPYEAWLVGWPYRQYYASRNDRIDLIYVRRLPIYNSEPDGYAVFHIPMEYINQVVQQEVGDADGSLLIGLNGNILYSDDELFSCGDAFPNREDLVAYAKTLRSTLLTSNLNSALDCCYILSNHILLTQFSAAFLKLLPAFFLFLLLILSCAFGYSLLMLGPLERILHHVPAPAGKQDGYEYQQLSNTMTSMSSCIDLLTEELQRNLLPIQERYIIELTTNYTDISAQVARYEEIGISLPYEHFAVILVDCSNIEGFSNLSNKEQIKLLVRDRLTKALSVSNIVYSATVTQERLIFLVNSRSDTILQNVQQCCTDVTAELQALLPQIPSFAVGSYTSSEHAIPYYAYLQARRNMAFSQGSDDGELLMADSPAPALPSVDTQTADSITGLLLDHNIDGLETYLSELFHSALKDDSELENTRLLAISCLCITLSRMVELELDIVPDQASSTLKKLSHADSGNSCIRLLLDYFSVAINGEKELPAEAEIHVNKAIAFIQEHYSENITIPDIAADVALSPIYLNKLFKLSTGRTISGYLNLFRAEKAKEMLASTSLSLNEISSNLGYNDVRSLVRFFKKYNGMTPGEYRQSLANEETTSS